MNYDVAPIFAGKTVEWLEAVDVAHWIKTSGDQDVAAKKQAAIQEALRNLKESEGD